jgi:hypothetical protein
VGVCSGVAGVSIALSTITLVGTWLLVLFDDTTATPVRLFKPPLGMDDGGSKTRLAEACGGVLTTLGVICLSTILESAILGVIGTQGVDVRGEWLAVGAVVSVAAILESAILGVIGTQGVDVRGEWLAVGAVVSVAARPMEPREGGPSCAADAA